MRAKFRFVSSLLISVLPVFADATYKTLPFTQDWTNNALITAANDWSGVPGIEGFSANHISATNVDPQTILTGALTAAALQVFADSTSTNPSTGGVYESRLTDPTISLNGSGSADTPHLIIYLNTTGNTNIRVRYNLRDLDTQTGTGIGNKQVALQYRIGNSGDFINIPGAYIANAADNGGGAVTKVSAVDVTLPAGAENQSQLQLRILTTDSAGSDELVGIDDIQITADGSGPSLPTISISNVSLNEGNSGTTNFTFNVSLTAAATSAVTFNIAAAGSGSNPATAVTDFAAPPASGSIAIGQDSTTIIVPVIGDTTPETDETFTVTLSAISGATPGSISATGTILNEDGPPPTSCGSPATLISAIQGSGLSAALTGTQTVEAIVTAKGLGGYFLQEEVADQDADAATSEGIFVFDSANTVAAGDKVRLTGNVIDFTSSGILLTEFNSVAAFTVCSASNTLPPAVNVAFPVANSSFLERFEGMRVQLPSGLVVTGNDTLGAFGEVTLATERIYSPTEVALPGAAANTRLAADALKTIVLDDLSSLTNASLDPKPFPQNGLDADLPRTLRVGDTVNGQITGILDHRFGLYRIHQPSVNFNFTNPRPAVPPSYGAQAIRVASFNVLNYFITFGSSNTCGPNGNVSCRGASDATEFGLQAAKIVTAINTLDAAIVGLLEIENNPTVTGAQADLVSKLNAAAGFTKWDYINTGGSAGTDSIRVALIYQPARVSPVGNYRVLTSIAADPNAGLLKTVDPRAFSDRNRPALAQTFQVNNARPSLSKFTVVVNHWKSKGSSCTNDPDTGDQQADCNRSRVSMAQALIDWLATDPTSSADPDFVILGDLNAYSKEDPIRALTDTSFTLAAAGATAPATAFPANANATYRHLNAIFTPTDYSYQFSSQSGFLDHILVSRPLDRLVIDFRPWHINADEPSIFEYETSNKSAGQLSTLYNPDQFRASDHDAVLATVNPLCGDIDNDGDVDAADLTLMRAAIGKQASTVDRRLDFDGSGGTISLTDYQAWSRCYAQFRER